MKAQSIAVALSRAIGARNRCIASGNLEWQTKWEAEIVSLMDDAPYGSGFDSGTRLDDDSSPERLEFTTDFHHMDDFGGYCGWSGHGVIVTGSLEFGISLRVTGANRRDIKPYISEVFSAWLESDAPVGSMRTA